MLKKIVFVLISFIALVSYGEAMTIGNVEMEESMLADDQVLILNGAGIREKFFTTMYVAGLYLKAKNSDYQQIINMDEPMAIKLKITSKLITAERFKEACEGGFQSSTHGNTAPLKTQIDLFNAAFSQKFNPGDVYDFVYVKGVGTRYFRNGKLIVTIDGLDFKKALFGIWIIDKPYHKSEALRSGMLGLPIK